MFTFVALFLQRVKTIGTKVAIHLKRFLLLYSIYFQLKDKPREIDCTANLMSSFCDDRMEKNIALRSRVAINSHYQAACVYNFVHLSHGTLEQRTVICTLLFSVRPSTLHIVKPSKYKAFLYKGIFSFASRFAKTFFRTRKQILIVYCFIFAFARIASNTYRIYISDAIFICFYFHAPDQYKGKDKFSMFIKILMNENK